MEFSINPSSSNEHPAFHHPWRVCVGGGRVGEALRADFQKHLEMIQQEMPFQYLRMHGLFHEDMMVYREESDGTPVYNWQYIDLVFDHWLSIGIRPFVELGFMPYDLASGELTVFWWKGNVTPPKDYDRWAELVEKFTRHCIERYGLEEVLQWYFEVWNEPNLSFFWDGDFEEYMKLYAASAAAIKKVDSSLRVGGPATSGSGDNIGHAPWLADFLRVIKERELPLDFMTTHPYPTRHPFDPEAGGSMVWDVPERQKLDLEGIDVDLAAAGLTGIERHYTEWNNSPSPRDLTHDTAFLAPFVIRENVRYRQHFESLSYWTLSDIFEENRQGDTPFHGGFGMVNIQGFKKPAYHGYWFLSQLGTERLAEGDNYVATRRADGTIVILCWNYCHYREGLSDQVFKTLPQQERYSLFVEHGDDTFNITIPEMPASATAHLTRFDREHGSVFDAWLRMGAPEHILREQAAELKQAHQLHRETVNLSQGVCSLTVPPHGVVMLEIQA